VLFLGSIKKIYLVDFPELIMRKAVRIHVQNIFDMKCKIQSAFSVPPPLLMVVSHAVPYNAPDSTRPSTY